MSEQQLQVAETELPLQVSSPAPVVGQPQEETPDELNACHELDENALVDDELYRQERAQLIKRRDELGDIFDKGRVALGGGAIALSATVMKDLAPTASASTKGLLVFSWLFLTASLICSILTVYLAGLSHERQRCILDDDRRAGNGEKRMLKHGSANGFTTWLFWLNPGSVLLLMVGLVLLGITFRDAFSGAGSSGKETDKNADGTTTMSDKNKTTKDTKASDGQKSFGASSRPVSPKNPNSQGGSSSGGTKK